MDYNLSELKSSSINSASALETFSRQHEEEMRAIARANQEKIQREEKMVAGAEANIAQKELLEQQIDFLQKQNELLANNYLTLKEMFDAQVEAYRDAKEELKQSKRFNIAMMVISVVAMLAAIASPIVTILVSKVGI